MRINFDMDGTIANLYGVENWLDCLINEDAYPYAVAETLVNMNVLARYLNKLQKMGCEIGIISWLAKNGADEYNREVTRVKKNWIKKHLRSIKFDYVEIIEYGYCKNEFCGSDEDILFDDEKNNREEWTGKAFDETEILKVLKELIENRGALN